MTLDATEASAVLKVLLAVAAADGIVDDEERSTLEAVAYRAGVEADDDPDVDLDAELRRIRSPAARQLTLRASFAIAAVDGRCSPEEHAILLRVHAAFGVPLAADALVSDEQQWIARMGGARTALTRATDDFLRELARGASSLDASAYEEMLGRLESRKRRALEAAVSPA